MAFVSDLRFAGRQLRKQPGFTVVVLTTLALCIGANTAIFSVLDATLLRPLPYPEPDRLAQVITADLVRENNENDSQTGALFEAVRDHTLGLDVAAHAGQSAVNFFKGQARLVQEERVSAGFFHVLGVEPMVGREFTREQDVPGGPKVVVLSYDFWRGTLRGDASIVGQTIDLRGEPYQVVAVMPRGFRTPSHSSISEATVPPVDLWTPLRPSLEGEGEGDNYGVIARLRPGVSWPEVTGQLQALSQGLMQMPKFPHSIKFFEERVVPLQGALTRDMRRSLMLTWAAVLIVLLIGCVNVAGLLMSRAPARAREIATRLAVGGGRGAIVRQLMTESLLLSLAGFGAGLLLGAFAADWLKRLGAVNFEIAQPIRLDGRVMAAMAILAGVTSLIFGLLPAIQASRMDIRTALAESGRGMAGSRNRLRGILVVGEIALSLTLLVTAGLLLRTLDHFNRLSAGFDSRNLVVGETSLSDSRYADFKSVAKLYREGLERIRSIPGVKSAAVALTLPYERPLNWRYRQLDGFSGEPPKGRMTEAVYVTPGYFEAMAIPLLRGRGLTEADAPDSGKTAVVSKTFAERVFGSVGAAIGRHIAVDNPVTREIVGVAGDVQLHSGLAGSGMPMTVEATVYLPVWQTSGKFLAYVHQWFSPKWVVRTAAAPAQIGPGIQAAIKEGEPQLPIGHFRTMEEVSGQYLQEQRYTTALFSMLAALGLALAAIGLYGLISNAIAQRTYELGVRMALGATAWQMVLATVRPAILLALAGVGVGVLAARAAGRLLTSLLWGVDPADPATLVAMSGLLLATAVIASLIPCLRILKLDPARTLHGQ
jgi:predicted permease